MLYLPINKSWIVSATAQRIYLVCALAAIAMFGTLVASRAALNASGATSLAVSSISLLAVKLLLWPGILGTGILTVAMWYFWFTFDDSHWLRKSFWFLPLYCLIALGPAFYYFCVYRRSRAIDQANQKIRPFTQN